MKIIEPHGRYVKLRYGQRKIFVDGHDIHMISHLQQEIITGWWLVSTPLKNDGVKVSWDYDIPN